MYEFNLQAFKNELFGVSLKKKIDMKQEQLYIKEWVKYKHLTISKIANKLGITISSLSESLNSGNFKIQRLFEIAKALDISTPQLFTNPEALKESGCNDILCPYCHKPIKVTIEKASTKSNKQKYD